MKLGVQQEFSVFDRFGQLLLLFRANVVSQDLLDTPSSFYVITSDNHMQIFFNYSISCFSADTWLWLSWCRFRIATHLLGHTHVIFAVLPFVLLLFWSLLSLFQICSFFFLHSCSCLFHRALQSFRINKLYISLCIIPKAPFRKTTQLICPWASVFILNDCIRHDCDGRPDHPHSFRIH